LLHGVTPFLALISRLPDANQGGELHGLAYREKVPVSMKLPVQPARNWLAAIITDKKKPLYQLLTFSLGRQSQRGTKPRLFFRLNPP